MNRVVLDASALLALLNAERGSEEVERVIPGAAISTVNLSEIVAKLVENGMPEEAVRSVLSDIELEIHPSISKRPTGPDPSGNRRGSSGCPWEIGPASLSGAGSDCPC